MSNIEADAEAPEPLALDQFLKLCGVVATGGQAKQMIQGGAVRVNGLVETRRRKKLSVGDQIEVNGEIFQVQLIDDDA